MKEITKKINADNIFLSESTLYFDIETTGFSPANTSIYLIGCIYLKGCDCFITQFFAETPDEEILILEGFFGLLKDYSVLIHYNGSGFDIPYIIKKCALLNLPCDFTGIKSIDIYKAIQPVKSIFKLINLKQKTVEEFFGIRRNDPYSGGELINVYNSYVSCPDSKQLDILLAHNHDDVYGMLLIAPIMDYTCILNDDYTIESMEAKDVLTSGSIAKKEIYITLKLNKDLPVRVSTGNSNYYCTMFHNTAKISIKAHTDELKFFYPNYNDYYYLPGEDCAIHKSVAFYVDKNYRTKAKAANCYSKKTGVFLPQYAETITPYFKIDYFDIITYFEYTDDFVNNTSLIRKYVNHIFATLL